MRLFSKWNSLLLVSGLTLSLAGAACGDDDESDTSSATGGKGGSTAAGKGGSAAGGKGGSAAGGKGGSGGTAPATAESCKAHTDELAASLPSGCSACACKEDLQTVSACDGACWNLIMCAAEKCPDMSQSCAQNMCSSEISAALSAGTVGNVPGIGTILQGACKSACSASGADAGI